MENPEKKLFELLSDPVANKHLLPFVHHYDFVNGEGFLSSGSIDSETDMLAHLIFKRHGEFGFIYKLFLEIPSDQNEKQKRISPYLMEIKEDRKEGNSSPVSLVHERLTNKEIKECFRHLSYIYKEKSSKFYISYDNSLAHCSKKFKEIEEPLLHYSDFYGGSFKGDKRDPSEFIKEKKEDLEDFLKQVDQDQIIRGTVGNIEELLSSCQPFFKSFFYEASTKQGYFEVKSTLGDSERKELMRRALPIMDKGENSFFSTSVSWLQGSVRRLQKNTMSSFTHTSYPKLRTLLDPSKVFFGFDEITDSESHTKEPSEGLNSK